MARPALRRFGMLTLFAAALAQLWLPVLGTPWRMVQADGQFVVMCTAQGLQKIWRERLAADEESPQTQSSACPICLLSHAPALPVTDLAQLWSAAHVAVAEQHPTRTLTTRWRDGRHIRAPPSA